MISPEVVCVVGVTTVGQSVVAGQVGQSVVAIVVTVGHSTGVLVVGQGGRAVGHGGAGAV